MKTDAEQVITPNAESVWAEESQDRVAKQPEPAARGVLNVCLIALAVAAAVVAWVYISSRRDLDAKALELAAIRNPNPGEVAAKMAAAANHWTLLMILASVSGGTIVCATGVVCSKKLQSLWLARQAWLSQESDLRAQKLMGQLADARVSDEESRNALEQAQAKMAHAQAQMTQFAENQTQLQRELEQRRQAAKSFNQQTQQLERSKGVLEMHVHARTAELQKVQNRTEQILQSAGEGVCGFDLQGKAIFVNPAATRFLGWKGDELIGKNEEAIFFSTMPQVGNETPSLAQDAKDGGQGQHVFFRKDGTCFPVEYMRTPIKENERVVGAVVMFRDITERRLAEDKLAHKAAELARSNRELEQFAFVASHDLQEPLRKIQAFGDRLKLKCDAVKMEEGRDYLERMQNAAARMQTLINDLLTFSRVISSAQPFVAVDLAAVTKEVLGDLEHRIEKTNAQIQVGKLPTVQADPTQMRQLLQNLMGNALKFQSPGNVPVLKVDSEMVTREQLRERAIFTSLPAPCPGDKFALMTVSDNGIGFEEQYLEKIFAVFQRLHGRSDYEGTGVGLAVCRRITDRHNGLITAQSKPGAGSTFIFALPIQQPPPQESPQ